MRSSSVVAAIGLSFTALLIGASTCADGTAHAEAHDLKNAAKESQGNTAALAVSEYTSPGLLGDFGPDLLRLLMGWGKASGRGVITGHVYDADTGEGIPGVRVEAVPEGDGAVSCSEPSDKSGLYRIESVSEGPTEVTPRNVEGYPPFGWWEDSVLVEVPADTPCENIDFILSKGILLSGVVVDKDDTPIQGAQVRCVGNGTSQLQHSDADGWFEFRVAANRPVWLHAQHEDLGTPLCGPFGPFDRPQTVALTLCAAGSVSGKVVDGAGQPVPDVVVVAEPRMDRVLVDETAFRRKAL
ncbi:MAG TPA: carboxypeptidase regulatory-like domain-containing protein, partial [Candidatus Hydrogenedentes bacterium]|nr:carboxypeptidase regulatory-like domain-containing protein [Candidatus Hydrogenedentota bacterium]